MSALEQSIKAYFGVIQPADLKSIVSMFQRKTLERGDFLLQTGQQCQYLAFVQTGLMRMFVNVDGKEVTQWISTPGYFATDLSSYVFGTSSRWNIQALTHTELYCINRNDYQKLGTLVPAWHQLEKMFITRCFTVLEDRIFSHLAMTAEERYHQFYQSHKELFTQVPQQFIASMLGMTPETFSRIRKKQVS